MVSIVYIQVLLLGICSASSFSGYAVRNFKSKADTGNDVSNKRITTGSSNAYTTQSSSSRLNDVGTESFVTYLDTSKEDDQQEKLGLRAFGVPGQDFPIYGEIPPTGFSCSQQEYPGYYADVETRCQVFHICQQNGRQDSFLCPNATVFNQQVFVCDWWRSVECDQAPNHFHLNSELFKVQRGGVKQDVGPQDAQQEEDYLEDKKQLSGNGFDQ